MAFHIKFMLSYEVWYDVNVALMGPICRLTALSFCYKDGNTITKNNDEKLSDY